MRKVIFLDIDGVLSPKWWVNDKPSDRYGCLFDSKAVANLAKVISKTEADIVISSSWKCIGLEKIRMMWEERKLPGRIIDVTPDFNSVAILLDSNVDNNDILENRGCEIKGWLSQHGDEVSHYAIIDDLDDILPEQQSHFVWTDPEVGMTEWDAARAIMILNHMKYAKEDISRS